MCACLFGDWSSFAEGISAESLHLAPVTFGRAESVLSGALVPDYAVNTVLSLILGASVGVGLLPVARLPVFLALCGWIYLFEVDFVSNSIAHKLIISALIVMLLAPQSLGGQRIAAWPERVLQGTLLLLYVGNALGKGVYGDWFDSPLLLRVAVDGLCRTELAAWLINNAPLDIWSLLMVGALATEALIPFFLLSRKMRTTGIALGVVFHLGIAFLFQGFWTVSAVVLSYYSLFFPLPGSGVRADKV
jgi:hypothetical protein